MKLSVVQLVQRSDFKRVSDAIPITKSRPKEKVDPPAKFEGVYAPSYTYAIALRLEALEAELQKQNAEYKVAVERARLLHRDITRAFRELTDISAGLDP
ncbi:hypothetical protein FRC16_000260 [Serendipita sp. 398]|nr:hypothetical protein FRC16_000260 [Serendipita sp. 398]